MNYDGDVYWNKGCKHEINQDSVILLQALTPRGRVAMAAVCDGMGGMDEGETASGYLMEELVTWFYDGLLDKVCRKKALWVIRRSVERKVYQVQSRLRQYCAKRGLAMGTTFSMLVLWEKKYLMWHLGDSRIYRVRNSRKRSLELMTKDHVDESGRLTKCVGGFGFFVPDFRMGSVKSGEAFLLCSDGFRNRIGADELAGVLAAERMRGDRIRKRLGEIGEAAVRRGECDDLSAVYIRIYDRKHERGNADG